MCRISSTIVIIMYSISSITMSIIIDYHIDACAQASLFLFYKQLEKGDSKKFQVLVKQMIDRLIYVYCLILIQYVNICVTYMINNNNKLVVID